MRRLIPAALILLSFCAPTSAADTPDASLAFIEGRYAEIIALAEQDPNADHLALAARSALAEMMSTQSQTISIPAAKEAAILAERALALDPRHVEGRLQLAIALSLQARMMTSREAMKSGYGGTSRDLVKSVLKDEPANAYAHAFMAVWNIEVKRRGGGMGAAMMGASVTNARKHYAQAISGNQDDASIHWQYAKALTALNARKYRGEIDNALSAAISAEANSEIEHVMQARAEVLQIALETQDRRYCEQLAAQML